MHKKIICIFIVVTLVLSTLVGCGFRLKGFYNLKDKVYKGIAISVVSGPRNHDARILNKVKHGIKNYDFKYTDNLSLANYYIEIIEAKYNKEIQTKSATGLVKQYSLNFYVKYAIHQHSNDNKFVVVKSIDIINLEKDYTYEPQNVLGSDSEEDIIANNLRKEASDQILNVLTRVIDKKNSISNNNAN